MNKWKLAFFILLGLIVVVPACMAVSLACVLSMEGPTHTPTLPLRTESKSWTDSNGVTHFSTDIK